jgi:hypothetical protein
MHSVLGVSRPRLLIYFVSYEVGLWSRGSLVGTVTTTARSGVRILIGKTSTLILPLRSQPSHGVLCYRGSNEAEGCGWSLNLRLVPRLRKIGVIPLLPLYAFIAFSHRGKFTVNGMLGPAKWFTVFLSLMVQLRKVSRNFWVLECQYN